VAELRIKHVTSQPVLVLPRHGRIPRKMIKLEAKQYFFCLNVDRTTKRLHIFYERRGR